VIRKLKEAAPRSGFFEREQYNAVRGRLKPDLQVAAAIAYTYGWRMQSEVLALERRQLDLDAGTLRLDPGTTKNNEGRLVYLTPELARLLREQLERIRAVERKTGRIIPFLFPYLRGRRRIGQRRPDFRKAWATACEKAGVPGMLRHDCRRTAVRNLVNAGVPERVAMTITGHKTRSVFDRYHIVSPADLQAAMRRLAEADGHVSGHVRAGALDTRTATPENH
jgi:integrase